MESIGKEDEEKEEDKEESHTNTGNHWVLILNLFPVVPQYMAHARILEPQPRTGVEVFCYGGAER